MLESILDLFFPRECPVCGNPSDRPGRHVCSDCLNRFSTVPPDAGIAAALWFDGTARRLIHEFKFRSQLHLREDLVDFLEGAALVHYDVAKVDLVVPIPSVWFRCWLRGYNQSALLAKSLARRLKLPFDPRILRRKGLPRRQASLDSAGRAKNAKGTFKVPVRKSAAVKGKTILLVDDIRTTGATLLEARKTLLAAGAKSVLALALAKTGE